MAVHNAIRKRTTGDYVIFVILTFLMLVIAIPFYNTIVISVETSAAYARNPLSLYPAEFSMDNYRFMFKNNAILYGYRNTVFIAAIGLVYGMTISVMMAYAFSRQFPGKKFFFLLMLFTMFFGGGTVPTFLIMKKLKLINKLLGIILMSGVSSFNIIIMKNGFESTPPALEEAALIDGANDLQIFLRVMLPLQKPLLATFSLFTIVSYWNSWYWPLLLLNSPTKQTLQVVLRAIVNDASQATEVASSGSATAQTFSQGVKMAAVMITMGPIMIVYPFLQKYFNKGVMVGAIKM